MSDDEFGLPTPEEPDVEEFTVLDYLSVEYAEARTLEEAIELRGAKAFFRDVTAEEFADDTPPTMTKIGFAELLAESTWRKEENDRHLLVESLAASVQKGDILRVVQCSEDVNEWGYVFVAADGTILPFSSFHDYDDRFFLKALRSLRPSERLLCRVRQTRCDGQDGIEVDPGFCWRIYSCKVTVYREEWSGV